MKTLIFVVAALGACGGGSATSGTSGPAATAAPTSLVNVDADGVGLGGYDPTSYGKYGKAVTGTPEYSIAYGGATYRFSSADQRDTFDGTKHPPQYGGFCAYAASQGRLQPANPIVFEILDGQLLVFTNPELKDLFDKDPAAAKLKADANWPGLVKQHGK